MSKARALRPLARPLVLIGMSLVQSTPDAHSPPCRVVAAGSRAPRADIQMQRVRQPRKRETVENFIWSRDC